eukprot:3174533-Pyramimonas_sp.AAC.1
MDQRVRSSRRATFGRAPSFLADRGRVQRDSGRSRRGPAPPERSEHARDGGRPRRLAGPRRHG